MSLLRILLATAVVAGIIVFWTYVQRLREIFQTSGEIANFQFAFDSPTIYWLVGFAVICGLIYAAFKRS